MTTGPLLAEEPYQERQDQADEEACRQGKIERGVSPPDGEVAREPPDPPGLPRQQDENAQARENQPRDDEYLADRRHDSIIADFGE